MASSATSMSAESLPRISKTLHTVLRNVICRDGGRPIDVFSVWSTTYTTWRFTKELNYTTMVLIEMSGPPSPNTLNDTEPLEQLIGNVGCETVAAYRLQNYRHITPAG